MFSPLREFLSSLNLWSPAPSKGTTPRTDVGALSTPPYRVVSQPDWELVRNDRVYYEGPRTKAVINSPCFEASVEGRIHVVVLPEIAFSSREELRLTIESWLQRDDVFSSDFLARHFIVKPCTARNRGPRALTTEKVAVARPNLELEYSQGIWQPRQELTCSHIEELPVGPYFIIGKHIHQAWRRYPDTLDSFVCGTEPDGTEALKFRALESSIGIHKAVAVPSRLYYTTSKEKPLNGKRVTIKDNFKVNGIKTTQTNLAWTKLYGPERVNAALVELLMAKGAIIVGKTKMCSFASSEEATDGWIDFHAPFNPRADGYQSSSGSTTGGATSLAGYDWIDFSVGTDTTGSIRWPAAWHGLFGLRATYGAADMENVFHACRNFDTVGLLGRDLQTLETVAAASLAAKHGAMSRPTTILFSTDFLPWGDQRQQSMVNEFVCVLEKHLGVKRKPIEITKLWEMSPPEAAHGKSLKEYIKDTAFNLFYYEGYHDPDFVNFREEYEETFGKRPYVGPYMRWKWEKGSLITKKQNTQAKKELKVYQDWFQDEVIGKAEAASPGTILILPCGTTEPKYRDDPNKPPGPVAPFSNNYIASMIGLPQLVIPIGQMPYESRVSECTEYLPVVSTIVGPKNSDIDLIKLAADALADAGWATTVKTGELAFEMEPKANLCPIRNVVDPCPSPFAFDSLLPKPSPSAVDSGLPTPSSSIVDSPLPMPEARDKSSTL